MTIRARDGSPSGSTPAGTSCASGTPTSASTPVPHTTWSGEVSLTSGTSSTARSSSVSSAPHRCSIGSSASSTIWSNFSARVVVAGVEAG